MVLHSLLVFGLLDAAVLPPSDEFFGDCVFEGGGGACFLLSHSLRRSRAKSDLRRQMPVENKDILQAADWQIEISSCCYQMLLQFFRGFFKNPLGGRLE